MKKHIIIAVVILVLVVGIGVGWYFSKNKTAPNGLNQNQNLAAQVNNQPDLANQPVASEDHPLIKDDFSILLPQGWQEVAPAMAGVTLSVIDTTGDYSDPAVQKINFKNNYNVAHDQLKGRNLDEYRDYVKGIVKQIAPDVVFSSEGMLAINGQESRIFEGEMNKQGVDIHFMTFLIQGKNNDMWNVSFNSLKSDWNKNALLFGRIGNSFQVIK